MNYLPAKYPQRWKAFQDHSYKQIEELMTGYGKVDILWLDGGWVRPFSSIDTSVSWQKAITIEQDIDMPRIAAMARSHQPGLLVVDRTVGGEYENYITPEGHVPNADLGVPWETCLPMGTSWSWVPNEQYKSTDEIIRTLVKVVSRGGSLLLNVAPGPDGQLDSAAYVRLKEVGAWLKVNGEAIYGTVPSSWEREQPKIHSGIGSTWNVRPVDRNYINGTLYFIIDPIDQTPFRFRFLGKHPPKIKVLGFTEYPTIERDGDELVVSLPKSIVSRTRTLVTLAFERKQARGFKWFPDPK